MAQDKTRHTGGTWMVQTWNYQDRHRRNVPVIVAKSDAICELYNLWDREQDREQERLANARLIAAAPEMLDALREMLSMFGDNEQYDDDSAQVIAQTRQAIAKAEGGEA